MSRDLGDVLHYFLPETVPQGSDAAPSSAAGGRRLVGVPLGQGDLLRGAFVWHLAVELAGQGAPTTLIASRHDSAEALWPVPGAPGTELVLSGADGLEALAETALGIARTRPASARQRGFGLVHLPRVWLEQAPKDHPLLSWTLLFTSGDPRDRRDRRETAELATHLLTRSPGARVGVTIHGVSRLEEAREAFETVAAEVEGRTGASPVSYGVLLEDLQVYRALTQRRPIGLSAPQSRPARALRDVARLLLEDDAKDPDG